MTARPASLPAVADTTEALLEALLFSVSHDLRSPLLTMSLSADLIENGTQDAPTDGSVAVALEALRHGAKDLERMLQALHGLSRAMRKTIEPARATLQMVLGGHVVVSDVADLGRVAIAVDPLVVRDLLDAVSPDAPIDVHVHLDGDAVVLSLPSPEALTDASSPLGALTASLQVHAGTAVETLAVRQVLLERQGGVVRVEGGRLRAWLPLADGDAS